MPPFYRPYAVVALSAGSYTAISRLIQNATKNTSPANLQTLNKAISTGHSGLMTICVLYALRSSQWHDPRSASAQSEIKQTSGRYLDDSANPTIQNASQLANDLSAWETGYLLYDTWMLLALQRQRSATDSYRQAGRSLAQKSPAILAHHVGLATALLTLQTYIGRGREKGMWIILAFFLMNASNPLMHALWFAKKNGRPTKVLEMAFIVVFAVSRFGPVWWVLHWYGSHHGIGAVQAYLKSRVPCQLGTGALVAMNGLWWVAMVKKAVMKSQLRLKDVSKEA